MLVLSRKPGEKLQIADDITITVLSVQGNRVRIGIDAPPHRRITRSELLELSIAVSDDCPACDWHAAAAS